MTDSRHGGISHPVRTAIPRYMAKLKESESEGAEKLFPQAIVGGKLAGVFHGGS